MNDDECPGAGKCHGCLKWCNECGDVAHVCDTRLRDERCDEHPHPVAWHLIRVERRMAEKKIADGKALVREGAALLESVVDMENARRAYDRQIEEIVNAVMGLPAQCGANGSEER